MLVIKPYIRTNAVKYAKKFAFAQNPLFENFAGIGGNCTNFVSQAIYAGSCQMNYTKTFGWYFISLNERSPSWTGVEYFYDFITKNQGIGPYGRDARLDELEIGDVIQLANNDVGYYHTLLVVGFSGYFRTLSPDSEEMVDAIKLGENIYDGLCVPMVSTLNGRTFIAGWIAHDVGWGGAMLQRELFQENGGKLGMKWIPELYPEKIGENLFKNDEIDVESRKSYIFEGKAVADENGIFAVTLGSGSSYAQLKIDINAKKAQLTSMTDKNTVADNILTYYEKRLSGGDFKSKCKPSIDFAIPDVDLQKEFGIKMVFRFAPKMRTTIGDIEIDGKRTMILAKPNLTCLAY